MSEAWIRSAGESQSDDPSAVEISLEWLIRLRWGAVVGQASDGRRRPRAPRGRAAARAAPRPRRDPGRQQRAPRGDPGAGSPRRRGLCGAALTLDTLLLSGLLHATGGPYNPFGVLYLVHITLAAVVLGARWTWFLAALSVGCYGLLFFSHVPARAPEPRRAGDEPAPSGHVGGLHASPPILTASFVVKLSSAIERRDAAMAEMRERAARHERLAS